MGLGIIYAEQIVLRIHDIALNIFRSTYQQRNLDDHHLFPKRLFVLIQLFFFRTGAGKRQRSVEVLNRVRRQKLIRQPVGIGIDSVEQLK